VLSGIYIRPCLFTQSKIHVDNYIVFNSSILKLGT